MQNIYAAGHWQYLAHRRLQIWGGTPHPKGMIAEKIPEVGVDFKTHKIPSLFL